MLTATQALAMLDLQAQMNAKVNPQWLSAGYPYLRAVVVEGAEAMEHHGWKWWKKQPRDLPQLQMELVDIWHFILSHLLVETGGDLAAAAGRVEALLSSQTDGVLLDGAERPYGALDTVSKLEYLIALAAVRRLDLGLFAALLVDVELDWDELYRQYVGKNVLNFFRQDHGYKAGTYRKEWAGREDNEHLVEVLAALDPTAGDFRDQVYNGLVARYPGPLVPGSCAQSPDRDGYPEPATQQHAN